MRESLGVVTSDAELSTVTHHVVDRSAAATAGAQRLQRAFVQPQWVYDSFNMRALLPVAPYAPVCVELRFFEPIFYADFYLKIFCFEIFLFSACLLFLC